jgi:hypothetical protein
VLAEGIIGGEKGIPNLGIEAGDPIDEA